MQGQPDTTMPTTRSPTTGPTHRTEWVTYAGLSASRGPGLAGVTFHPQQPGCILQTHWGHCPAGPTPHRRPHSHHRPRPSPRTPPRRPLPTGLTPSPRSNKYLFVQPQVLLTGAEHLRWLRLSEGAQGATYLLLHPRVLVSDGVQQDGGQPYSDKVRWQGQAWPRPTAWLSL